MSRTRFVLLAIHVALSALIIGVGALAADAADVYNGLELVAAVGILSAMVHAPSLLAYAKSSAALAQVRTGDPEAFEPSRAWLQEEPVLVRVYPTGMAERPQTIALKRTGTWLDNDEARRLARLIVASGQPAQGVKLTHAALKAHGFTADARRKDLLTQIVARGKGYTAGTTGGKATVYLKPEVAARHMERCRARGLMWQLSPTEGVSVPPVSTGNSHTHTEIHGNTEEG